MELGESKERKGGGFDVPFPSLGNDYRAETAVKAFNGPRALPSSWLGRPLQGTTPPPEAWLQRQLELA